MIPMTRISSWLLHGFTTSTHARAESLHEGTPAAERDYNFVDRGTMLRASKFTLALIVLTSLMPSFGMGQASVLSAKASNPYLRKIWTTENGLPQNSVTSILQTHDGYLWLGTLGGLARFDGMEFTVFNTVNTTELKSNRVRVLFEDSDSNLWIGTEHGGLTRYRHGVFTNYSVNDGLPSDTILSLAGDDQGDIWVGTTEGLARFHAGRFSSYGSDVGLQRAMIYAICPDVHGNLWVGVYGYGLIRFRAGEATTFADKSRLGGDVSAIHEDRDGTLWVGTRTELIRLDPANPSAGALTERHRIGWVKSIYEGTGGVIWAAADRGLLRWADGKEARFTSKEGLSDTKVHSVFVDRERDLWIGTEAGGLNRWRVSNVQAFAAAQGFTDQPTMSVLQDSAGTIWIGGSWGQGLSFYKNGKFSAYAYSHDRIDSPANLAEDHDGNLWLGDWKYGLGRLNIADGKLESYSPPGLSGDTVRSIYVDSKSALWIGTDQKGLYRFKDEQFTSYRVSDGLMNKHVNFITEDRGGAIWVGTPSGIGRFADGTFTNYRAPELSLVRTIHEDDQGALWVGTYGYGLFRFKDGKFSRITTKDGLFDDVVSVILDDGNGNFWMSGNRGIYRARQADLTDFAEGRLKTISCVSYGIADGMVVSETNGNGEPSGWKARDGKLWFPMIKGVVAIDPTLMNTQPPPVVIEQVTLDGGTLSPDQPVRISPGKRNLEIHYTALSLSRPEQIDFKYKLAGFDPDWVDAGGRRTAYYSHLPPGNYRFTVIADNGDGVWNMIGRSVQISVLPPLWTTKWFLALVTLGLIGLMTLAYRMRALHWARVHAAQEAFSQQLLASQEAERQRIAAELHDSLGQSLLIIKNRAVIALSSFPDQVSAKDQLEEISAGASQAVDEVREISYNLRSYQLDRFGLTKTLQALCMRASKISGIQFTADVQTIDDLFSKDTESSIYRIVQEAVNNIIKHSQAQEAGLAVFQRDGELHMRIHDNGQGFQPAQSNPAEPKLGGFGLIGMSERVRMLKGTCNIMSAPGKGTAITIRFPVVERLHA
jgi:signal transduction histidine kinase/ligand-binding sensor domain-containing protein